MSSQDWTDLWVTILCGEVHVGVGVDVCVDICGETVDPIVRNDAHSSADAVFDVDTAVFQEVDVASEGSHEPLLSDWLGDIGLIRKHRINRCLQQHNEQ